MKDFNEGLQKHLWKSELEYRAKVLPNGSNVEWLAPHCDNVRNIEEFLRTLGFKIREVMEEEIVSLFELEENGEDAVGEWERWVETTSGIVIHANDGDKQGYVERRKGEKHVTTFQYVYE